jgi:serine protease DegQ
LQPKQKATLGIIRSGKAMDVELLVGKRPKPVVARK